MAVGKEGNGSDALTLALRGKGDGQRAKRDEAKGPDSLPLAPGALPVRAVIQHHPASAADMDRIWADISKATRLLHPSPGLRTTGGWKPEVTLADGFRRAVEWQTKSREWLSGIKL